MDEGPEQRTPRIVVAEDDSAVLQLLHVTLRSLADVVLAVDGQDAWDKMQSGPVPDLLITDLMMPRLDGLALSRRVRSSSRLMAVPIIMLTARDAPGDAIAGINAGAHLYIKKPFQAEVLLSKVASVLRLSHP